MKIIFSLILLCGSFGAYAATLYFDGSQAAGTERMTNVKKTEFFFDREGNTLKLCGFWQYANGHREKFSHQWEINGSEIRKSGKALGSYYDGSMMMEENTGAGKYLSLEVSRYNETFFEYHFHHPDFGFVDADGWIVREPSAALRDTCPHSFR